MFPWLLIRSVFKTDAGSNTGVAQSNQNDQNMVKWTLQESVKREKKMFLDAEAKLFIFCTHCKFDIGMYKKFKLK